jgi:predicted negative regulator of RcsB-dependent stress response
MHQIDEYEQSEQVRGWLRQNGSSLLTGILLGLACVFGWQWWQGQGLRQQQEAATQYFSFIEAVEARDAGKAKAFVDAIRKDHGDSAYADFASLRYAALLQEQGKTSDAIAQLQGTLAGVEMEELKEVFVLRLVKLQLLAGKPKDAGKTLAGLGKPRLAATAQELRGDIAVATGDLEGARNAYLDALTTLDQASPMRNLVELKLIEAGGQPPAQPET